MENNRVLPALLNCWSELLAVLGCQGFPKTLQGLTEGKLNKAQQAGKVKPAAGEFKVKICSSYQLGSQSKSAPGKHIPS